MEECVPVAHEASIAFGIHGTSLCAMARKPLWEDTFSIFVIDRAPTEHVYVKLAFNKEALYLECCREIGGIEEMLYSLT